jgi:hypothetical protein
MLAAAAPALHQITDLAVQTLVSQLLLLGTVLHNLS